MGDWVLAPAGVSYEGTEGELYDVENDPHQWRNLWSDPARRSLRADLMGGSLRQPARSATDPASRGRPGLSSSTGRIRADRMTRARKPPDRPRMPGILLDGAGAARVAIAG